MRLLRACHCDMAHIISWLLWCLTASLLLFFRSSSFAHSSISVSGDLVMDADEDGDERSSDALCGLLSPPPLLAPFLPKKTRSFSDAVFLSARSAAFCSLLSIAFCAAQE